MLYLRQIIMAIDFGPHTQAERRRRHRKTARRYERRREIVVKLEIKLLLITHTPHVTGLMKTGKTAMGFLRIIDNDDDDAIAS